MAIQPRYAQAILGGSKLVEFRKRPLAPDIHTVIIYQSSPMQMIVGTFEVANVVLASPRQLWRRFGEIGGISRADLLTYYGDADRGVALLIGSARRFSRPVALTTLSPPPAVPQSFSYLPGNLLSQAAERAQIGAWQLA